VNDEAAQEESDEEWRPQLDSALVGGRGARKSKEEQKAADEERRVVRVEDRPPMKTMCTAVTQAGTGRRCGSVGSVSSSGCSTSTTGGRTANAFNSRLKNR
jgi:hypothetical protein